MSYSEWGFKENPFNTHPLSASKAGHDLIVGRKKEIQNLKRRLISSDKIITVEGQNGIGKTSVINVMLFDAYSESLRISSAPLFIPCRTTFQFDESISLSEFRRMVLIEVAQTILERRNQLPSLPGQTYRAKNAALDRFLNCAQLPSFNVGIAALSLGQNLETNTGIGFEKSGLEKSITDWIAEIFPNRESGAVVCVLDNLELLRTSQKAREIAEEFRDTVFSIPHVKWILCGALGIVHGIASSPRLDGRLHRPIVIQDLEEGMAGELFQKRKKFFQNMVHAKLPITQANFVEIFDMMRGNVRSALNEADEFCNWISDEGIDRDEFDEKHFEKWLEVELEETYQNVRSELRPRALDVFETACQFEVFSPSDCTEFGYESPQALRPHISSLESVGLLQSTIEESDKRRKTIQVTPKGWKVRSFLDRQDDQEIG